MYEKGDKFIPPNEQARINLGNQHEKLLLGQAQHVIKYGPDGNSINVDQLIPIPSVVSDIFSDLLFGEFPKIEFKTEQIDSQIADFMKDKEFQIKMLELSQYVSAIGTVFIKVFKVDDITHWECIPGNRTFWKEVNGELKEVIFFKKIDDPMEKQLIAYEVQEYKLEEEKLVVTSAIIHVSIGENEVKRVTIVDTQIFEDIDFIPVSKFRNLGIMGAKEGRSDYNGLEQLFAEVDNRVDQINNVLQEHSDPWTFMPPGILNPNGSFNRRNGKMVEKGANADANSVEYSVWDAKLDQNFEQINLQVKMIFFSAGISSPISGWMDKVGHDVESGTSLKWKSINTFSKINRKRRYCEDGLNRFYWIIGKFEGIPIEMDEVKYEWQDSLPLDDTTVIDNTIKQVNAQIMSRLTAIETINEIGTQEAQQEADQIKKEAGEAADLEARASAPVTV